MASRWCTDWKVGIKWINGVLYDMWQTYADDLQHAFHLNQIDVYINVRINNKRYLLGENFQL